MVRKFCILSLDGGGLRGLIPVKVLSHIEKEVAKRPIIDMFDLIAGTSTGGLIACGLTVPDSVGRQRYNLDKIQEIFTSKASEIFPGPTNAVANRIYEIVRPFFKAKYRANSLENELKNLFRDLDGTLHNHARLAKSIKPILISSYDVTHNKPAIFKTRYAREDENRNAFIHDICRATSAAPTYLPAYKFNYVENITCIDGGVFMNNPSMDALVEVMANKSNPLYKIDDREITDEEIYILSIGTGDYTGEMVNPETVEKRGGIKNWVRPITEVMMYAGSQATHYKMGRILKTNTNYLRINVKIQEKEFKDMANSTVKAREYLDKIYNDDYLNNSTVQNNLNKFLSAAGLV